MSKSRKLSVDDLLNNIDYEEIAKYKPQAFSISVINFIKFINGGSEADINPPVHYKMLDGLCDKKSFLANLCSRGLAKTSLFAEYLFLYLAITRKIPNFGSVSTAMYVTDSVDNGVKTLRKNMESRYSKSDVLQKLLPDVKFTDTYIELTNADGEKFGLRLYGAKSGIRGSKIFGKRPELCVIDDVVSDDDASSPTMLQKIKDTIYSGVLPALDPKRKKVIFNGTPFNKADPLYEAVESGAWYPNVYPVCEKFPCTKAEFKGAWEGRFTYEAIKEQYEVALYSGQIKTFRQEYMLRILSDENRMILDSDINWFNLSELLEYKARYNYFITTDFATSTNRKADYTVIGVWAVDNKQNRYLVDGVIGRQLMNQTFNDLFRLVQKYNPIGVGVEISGQQGAFISLIREEMLNRNIYFSFARSKENNKEGIPARTNKMERFRLSVPFWKNGKMFLPEQLKDTLLIQEILDELRCVTIDGIKSVHDDCLDMISQLEQMYLVYPDILQSKIGQAVDGIYTNENVLETGIGRSSYIV